MEYSIDAVIPWVDGNDPVLNSKRRSYAPEHLFSHNDSHGATRFASIGEIYWCVASINRFAPWISRIFIVTDGQDPKMDSFLSKHFPEGSMHARNFPLFRGLPLLLNSERTSPPITKSLILSDSSEGSA